MVILVVVLVLLQKLDLLVLLKGLGPIKIPKIRLLRDYFSQVLSLFISRFSQESLNLFSDHNLFQWQTMMKEINPFF